jgi:lactoylglutathione lyase
MKFGYCIFYVDLVEATLAFFEKAFKFSRRFQHESGTYGELDTGETVLAFASHEMGDAKLSGDYVRTSSDGKPLGMDLSFVAEDVSAAYAEALACSASPVAEPKPKSWGQIVGYVHSPHGVLIELCTLVTG